MQIRCIQRTKNIKNKIDKKHNIIKKIYIKIIYSNKFNLYMKNLKIDHNVLFNLFTNEIITNEIMSYN